MDGNNSSAGVRQSKRKRVFIDHGGAENTRNANFSSNGMSVVEGYQSVGQSSCRRRIAFRNSLLDNVPISGIHSGEFRSMATTQEQALQDITNQLPRGIGMITPLRNRSHVLHDISAPSATCFANHGENVDMNLISEVGKPIRIDVEPLSEAVQETRVLNTPQRKQRHVLQESRNDSEVYFGNSMDSEGITLKCDVGKHSLLDVQPVTQVSHNQLFEQELTALRCSSKDFSSIQVEHYIMKSRQQVQKIMSTLPDSSHQTSCMYTPLSWNKVGRINVHDCSGLDQSVAQADKNACSSVLISPRKWQKVSIEVVNRPVDDLANHNQDEQGACMGASDHDTYGDNDASRKSECVTNLHNLHGPLLPVKGRRFRYKSLKKILVEISERSTKNTSVQAIYTVNGARRKRLKCDAVTESVKVAEGICLKVDGPVNVQKISEASISGHVKRRGVVVCSVSEAIWKIFKRVYLNAQPQSEEFLNIRNPLIAEQLSFDHLQQENEFRTLQSSMTDEQRHVFDGIMSSVTSGQGIC
ncbi:hypothetical protein RIF29_39695 [Crotalaria pallida]|uniref:Uncharacterized protein n=1 Tax=Crotalaria pallida TaxID=3830 RepID=A0AAN9E807_CROPI